MSFMIFASLLQHVCAAATFVDGDHVSVRCREDSNGGWYTLLALYHLPGNGARMTHCVLLLGCTTALTVIWSGSGAVNVPTCWSWIIWTGHWRDIVAVFVKCQTLPHSRSYLLASSVYPVYSNMYSTEAPFCAVLTIYPGRYRLVRWLTTDSLSLSVGMQLFLGSESMRGTSRTFCVRLAISHRFCLGICSKRNSLIYCFL